MIDIQHARMVEQLKKPPAHIVAQTTRLKADLTHMLLGVTGEVGELVDAAKKFVIYGKDLDRENVIEELGDIEFYLEGIRQALSITREQTLAANIAKLGVRYAGGYSDQAAIERADKGEGR